MKNKGKILITKDAMCTGYLHQYGCKYWNTPNIDQLSKKGTIFLRHYSGASSTIMSNICMFTSDYAHKSPLKDYGLCHEPDRGNIDEALAVNGMVAAGLVHAPQILVVQ